MSYEPTVWKDGDLVTSAKLNKLEQGVANNGGNDMIGMTIEEDNSTITYTLNKTWQEIWDNNYTLICCESDELKVFYQINEINASDYGIRVVNPLDNFDERFAVVNADSYPTLTKSTAPAT